MDKLWVYALSSLLALGSLGFIVGWFVGNNGSDATVLAAVLPAILSIGGGILLFRATTQKENGDRHHSVINNISVFLFVVLLFAGSECGKSARQKADKYNLNKYFETCSNEELRTNESRTRLGLSPLKSEVFCK